MTSCPERVNHVLQQWLGEHLGCAAQVRGTGGPGARGLDKAEGWPTGVQTLNV